MPASGAGRRACLRSPAGGTLRRDPREPASSDETRDELAIVCSGAGCARRRSGGAARASARPGLSDRLRRRGRRLRPHAPDPHAAASRPASGRFPGDARLPRRADRRARLFPVRHQAEHGQGVPQRSSRAEADRGVGRGGPDRTMAAAIDRDRHDARLSGDRHRSASGRRRQRPSFRIGRRRRSRPAPDQYRRFGRTGRPRQRPRAAQKRRGDAGEAEDASHRRQHAPVHGRFGARRARFRPQRPSSGAGLSSHKRRSALPSRGDWGCATPISGNMPQSARLWRRCSSSIRSTPIFPCPRRRWRRSRTARTRS